MANIIKEVLFAANSDTNAIIAASGSEMFEQTPTEERLIRNATLDEGSAFNWYEVFNNSASPVEIRFDSRTDRVRVVPAYSVRSSENDIIYFQNILIVNLDTVNQIDADKIRINKRRVVYGGI